MKKSVSSQEAMNEVGKYSRDVSRDKVQSMVNDEQKVKNIFHKAGPLTKYMSDLGLVYSLLKDTITGKYKNCSWGVIATLVGALLYVVSPIDLIPDFIPVLGWMDDATAFGAALGATKIAIEEYKRWKR